MVVLSNGGKAVTQFPPNRIRPRPGFAGGFPEGPADIARAAEIVRAHDAGDSFRTIATRMEISRQRTHQLYKMAKAGGLDTAPASALPSPVSLLDSRPPARSNDEATTADPIDETNTLSAQSFQVSAP